MKPTRNQSSGGQKKAWKYGKDFADFHARHNREFYTPIFNRTIEVEMMDAGLSKEARVLAAIRRFSWGHMSDWAVDAMPKKKLTDPMPRPLTQEALGQILGLSKDAMSKACKYLRENGYLREHQFLYPEEKITLLDSVKNRESGSDSSNYRSPYLRFEELFYSEKADLGKIVAEKDAERKKAQEAALEATKEIRKIKRIVLIAWSKYEREHKDDDPLRCYAPAQNDTSVIVEQTANCNIDHISESGSDSEPERFLTPEAFPREPEPDSGEKASKSTKTAKGPFKPLNRTLKKTEKDRGSQSVPTEARLTDRHLAIVSAIPPELLERLNDSPSAILLDRIDRKIGNAPLSGLTERIKARWVTITALGILESLAADVQRAWAKSEADRTAGIPVQSETNVFEQAAELQRQKYGTQ